MNQDLRSSNRALVARLRRVTDMNNHEVSGQSGRGRKRLRRNSQKLNNTMENSDISWTKHTFNGWFGCTKISPGCENCYAQTLMETRWKKVKWGKGNPRKRTSAANWLQPLRWNRQAVEAGTRTLVFSESLGDLFDTEVPKQWRDDLFALIRDTPNLDWQLLTKRPNEAVKYGRSHPWPDNAWIGASVEDQKRAGRAQIITGIPAPVRFLSVEPLLGPVTLDLRGIDWIIVGGESGPRHRPMKLEWARSVRDQCRAAGVPFWFKQVGGHTPDAGGHLLDGVVHHEFPTPVRRRRVVPDAMELLAA